MNTKKKYTIACSFFDISKRRAFVLRCRFLMLMSLAMAGAGVQVAHGDIRPLALVASNPDCTLIVPQNPLSASGLATPYQLTATNPLNGSCNESNSSQTAFVQAAILDPATGKISIYNPLVIDKGDKPAKKPVKPTLPPNAVVGLWFGYNGGILTLQGSDDLNNSYCVNGIDNSEFGQFAYCNAVVFFKAAHKAISAGQLKIPKLGTGNDELACPSVRDFFVVDQDQSDNLPTTYLLSKNGRMAQDTRQNRLALKGETVITNPSDNRLVNVALDNVLGCKPWKAPDLADPGATVPALALNELQARKYQKAPVALIPAGDPMVLVDGLENLDKINAYRRGVDQRTVSSIQKASTDSYCENLFKIAPARFKVDETLLSAGSSPAPTASNLFAFMALRFVVTDSILQCSERLGTDNPVEVIYDANGIAIDAIIH